MENKVTRITTLEEHRQLLRKVFQTAKRRVLVVSPFITELAITRDRVPDLIATAIRRGVRVDVFTDNNLNKNSIGEMKTTAKYGIILLNQAGAKVTIVNGIHNKTLIRDDDLIAEGSFNWLSAVRDKGAGHQREERTMAVEGKQVEKMVEEYGEQFCGKVAQIHPASVQRQSISLSIDASKQVASSSCQNSSDDCNMILIGVAMFGLIGGVIYLLKEMVNIEPTVLATSHTYSSTTNPSGSSEGILILSVIIFIAFFVFVGIMALKQSKKKSYQAENKQTHNPYLGNACMDETVPISWIDGPDPVTYTALINHDVISPWD